jgi:hypothetical protein
MARTVRRSLASFAAIAVVSIFSLGCQAWKDATAQQQDQARFELKQDSQGRLIRLDKTTGEVVVVEGTRLIPVKPSAAVQTTPPSLPPSRLSTAAKSVAVTTPQPEQPSDSARRVEQIKPITLQPPELAKVPPEGVPSARAGAGQSASIAGATPVFVTAREQTPLTVLAKGTVVRLRGVEGDWYQIEFDDPRWGRRVGFVAKKNATILPADFRNMKPVDLSIRDRKPEGK